MNPRRAFLVRCITDPPPGRRSGPRFSPGAMPPPRCMLRAMPDRHALRTGVSLLLVTASPALVACSSSSSSNVHGPVYGGDGGPDSSDASEPDAGDDVSSPVDATATDGQGFDATMDATGDATGDAPVDVSTETGGMDAATDATPPPDGPSCSSTMAVV